MEVTTGERIVHVHIRNRSQGKQQLEEEQHMCMGGRPNVAKVRVFVMLCKWIKRSKCINIDV
jgi:hypothetical protein